MIPNGANEVLSNDEIDALLNLFELEGLPEELAELADFETGYPEPSRTVGDLDLLKPNRFTRDQMAVIERIQSVIARRLGGTISDRLRMEVECDCVAVEQLRFSTWMTQVERPIGVFIVDLDPLEHGAVVTLSSGLLHSIVDRMLGGVGESEDGPAELSEVQYAVSDSLVMPMIDRLVEGIREIVDVQPRIAGRFSNLAMAQAMPLHEVVLALHYQVSGQPLMGDIRLVVPFAALESHLGQLSKSRFVSAASHSGEYRQVLGGTVESVPLQLEVELAKTELTLSELLALQVGDVIPLAAKPSDPVEIPVHGKRKFLGSVGTRRNRFAVRVEQVVGAMESTR